MQFFLLATVAKLIKRVKLFCERDQGNLGVIHSAGSLRVGRFCAPHPQQITSEFRIVGTEPIQG